MVTFDFNKFCTSCITIVQIVQISPSAVYPSLMSGAGSIFKAGIVREPDGTVHRPIASQNVVGSYDKIQIHAYKYM